MRGDEEKLASGIGCSIALVAINFIPMGLVASSFAAGPFSSTRQMLSYRGTSLAFLILGAIGPAALLWRYAYRSDRIVIAVTLWMLIALFLFVGFLFHSAGGV